MGFFTPYPDPQTSRAIRAYGGPRFCFLAETIRSHKWNSSFGW